MLRWRLERLDQGFWKVGETIADPFGGVALGKDYVRNRQRVQLCDQTCRLLEHLGFSVFLRVHAMLVKETTYKGLFGEQKMRRERKSFFRRLAEKNGSPRIDYEEVIFCRTALS